jgi:hypothetical protein
MSELFPVAPPKAKAVRRGPLMDRLEQHFRDHRYESFTGQDLMVAFPDDRFDSIRSAIRRLLKEKTIKSTGMIRVSEKFPQPQPIPDVACLTLILGK